MTIDTKTLLQNQRADILSRLVELAVKDRKKSEAEIYRIDAQNLISELAVVDRALQSVNPPNRGVKYAGFKDAIDAIVAYLTEIDRPASRGEIIKAVLDGGFRPARGIPGDNVNKSISLFIVGPGKAKDRLAARRLKEIGGLIGLISWDDARFRSSL